MSEKISLDHQTSFLQPTPEDGTAMWNIVKKSTLDDNSPYKYIMMCEYFSETCIIAKHDDEAVGFITAFLQPQHPEVLFIWQIGVDASQRGKGIASSMLHELLRRDACKEVNYVEATVTPSNIASQTLFKKLAIELNTECNVSECFAATLFPGVDHEEELTYRIGPIS